MVSKMTIKQKIEKGIIPEEIKEIAKKEEIDEKVLIESIKKGEVVIPANKKKKKRKLCGIGKGLSVKINTNIGTSPLRMNIKEEIEKLKIAEKYGTDTVMDLSLGAILNEVRQEIIKQTEVPVGTVPIYQVGYELSRQKRDISEMTIDDILNIIERQAEEGVDFMTVHCGVTMKSLERMINEGRRLNIVSRGGSLLAVWMKKNNKENPMYEHYDKILEIAEEYDITLSLGDGFRPGAIVDATDRAQIEELITLGELAQRAWERGVQVMIEGPGHIPLHQIKTNVELEKSLCHNAPFYVLGPVVTDIAPGYDHITSAIGGALAAYFGADFLCYVTPSEHLRLPTIEDVKEGVIAAKIAAHAADIARGNKKAIEKELQMAIARHNLNWEKQIEISIDPVKSRKYREESEAYNQKVCSMCGEFCAIDQMNKIMKELGL